MLYIKLDLEANNMQELKFKKLHPKAVLPTYAKPGDAGMDLVATEIISNSDQYYEVKFGLAVEIPEGKVGLLFPRSSVTKKDLILKNCVGVIDSGYRGEITARFDVSPIFVYRLLLTALNGIAEAERFIDLQATPSEEFIDLAASAKQYEEGDKVVQLIIFDIPQFKSVWAETLSDSERGTVS